MFSRFRSEWRSEPTSPDALAQVVLFLADRPKESAHIGKNPERFAASLPDWEHVTLQFAEVLNKPIQKARVNSIEKMR